MRFFARYYKNYKKHLIITVCAVILSVVAEMLQPTLMSNIVDFGLVNMNFKYIVGCGLLMFLLAIFAIGLGIASVYSSAKVSQGFAFELRKNLFEHIQTFSFGNIDKFSVSSLITRITNDVNTLQMTFLMILRMLLRAPITLIFTFTMIMIIDAQLSLIVLAVIPVFTVIICSVAYLALQKFLDRQAMIDKMNVTVQEELVNIRLVKSFAREEFEKKQFNAVTDELQEKTIAAFNIAITIMPAMILILNITTLSIWWFGGNKFIAGNLEIGKLVAFITYVFNILFSVLMLSFVFLLIVRSKASAQRIIEVLAEKTDIKNKKHSSCNKIKIDTLEFKNVNFKYSESATDFILQDINFKINKGQAVAIIGATSSAKTTLVQLIPRFFDVSSGQILINNINIIDYDLEILRNSIGFVLQKNILFSGTIEENIRWGNPDANEEQIIAACKSACIHDFIISLPDKYQTNLGQMGVNISGGQKQRLCIARALIKHPQILILDDSTSAVDTTTEFEIYKSFRSELKDSIKIIIAQRISSVKNADKIIILDNGKISDIGTHNELLSSNKIYKEICHSQKNTKLG